MLQPTFLKSPEITTRIALRTDIPILQELIAKSVRGLSENYYSNQQIESAIKYIFGVDSQLVEDETYFLAEHKSLIVACGGWSKRDTLYGGDQHKAIVDPLLDPAKDAARIRAFFVHPDYARRGIGSVMIDLCENAAKLNGFRRMELGATLPGVPLYAAMGYLPIKEISQPMPDGVALEIVKMAKDMR